MKSSRSTTYASPKGPDSNRRAKRKQGERISKPSFSGSVCCFRDRIAKDASRFFSRKIDASPLFSLFSLFSSFVFMGFIIRWAGCWHSDNPVPAGPTDASGDRRRHVLPGGRSPVPCAGTGQVVLFRESHQLLLMGLGEHPFERASRTLQPMLAQWLPILPAQNDRPSMAAPPKTRRTVSSCPSIMLPGKTRRRNGNAPVVCSRIARPDGSWYAGGGQGIFRQARRNLLGRWTML
jgi:hypothetical protein